MLSREHSPTGLPLRRLRLSTVTSPGMEVGPVLSTVGGLARMPVGMLGPGA